MVTLLVRYSSPLMAFGHTARFDDRPSATTPTLSAVQGMVAAAAGVGRATPWPDWIAALHLAVRIDHAGTHITDYQTAGSQDMRQYRWLAGARKVSNQAVQTGSVKQSHITYTGDLARVDITAEAELDSKGRAKQRRQNVLSRRSYVADATFVIAVADPTGQITEVLAAPRWTLYAGRKSCPLTEPFVLGRTELPPEQAVAAIPTVPHPTEHLPTPDHLRRGHAEPGRQATRNALLFAQPKEAAPYEDRNDRASGFKRHQPQRRWRTDVTVPVVTTWFDVIDGLRRTGAPA
jgi:CRISPR system Cascade subunit CasD